MSLTWYSSTSTPFASSTRVTREGLLLLLEAAAP